jgi:hypothetical protein
VLRNIILEITVLDADGPQVVVIRRFADVVHDLSHDLHSFCELRCSRIVLQQSQRRVESDIVCGRFCQPLLPR